MQRAECQENASARMGVKQVRLSHYSCRQRRSDFVSRCCGDPNLPLNRLWPRKGLPARRARCCSECKRKNVCCFRRRLFILSKLDPRIVALDRSNRKRFLRLDNHPLLTCFARPNISKHHCLRNHRHRWPNSGGSRENQLSIPRIRIVRNDDNLIQEIRRWNRTFQGHLHPIRNRRWGWSPGRG